MTSLLEATATISTTCGLSNLGCVKMRQPTFAPDFPVGSNSCCLYFASFAFNNPRWYSVAERNYKSSEKTADKFK